MWPVDGCASSHSSTLASPETLDYSYITLWLYLNLLHISTNVCTIYTSLAFLRVILYIPLGKSKPHACPVKCKEGGIKIGALHLTPT